MKKIALIIVILLHSIVGFCQQYYGQIWISGIDGQQIIFKNNTVTTKKGVHINKYFYTGNSNICDSNGNLILLSDGYNIYDTLGNYLDGGDTMVYSELFNKFHGWSGYSQSSIFLPMDSDKYYFITPAYHQGNACWGCHFDLMLYNVIDMKANNGAGKVTKKMVHFLESTLLSRTQMMACRHANGKDWWLLKQGGDSNIVYKFLFTQDSVYNYGRQVFDEPYWSIWDTRGQSVFNQVGNQYATTCQGDFENNLVFLADFDRCYGTLSNQKTIQVPFVSWNNPADTNLKDKNSVGLAFSPNGRFLYCILAYNIFQYDLQDNTFYHVAGLDTSFLQFQNYQTAYLAPNNKIYIGNFGGTGKQMSVIDNPDVKGAGCNFCPKCLRTDSLFYGYLGTPPCMPNYGLGARVCYPESTEQLAVSSEQLAVYPNPSSTKIFIRYVTAKHEAVYKQLYNSIGQLILSTKENEIDVRNLSKGVYYLKIENKTKKVIVE